jgi:tRNA (Thr-GGU) A37 N-methylase
MDTVERGIFSTRSPLRPNHIGLSIVELAGVQNNIVHLKGVDVLDKTPLLDLKPYIESFDYVENSRSGWMQGTKKEVAEKRSDDRFI